MNVCHALSRIGFVLVLALVAACGSEGPFVPGTRHVTFNLPMQGDDGGVTAALIRMGGFADLQDGEAPSLLMNQQNNGYTREAMIFSDFTDVMVGLQIKNGFGDELYPSPVEAGMMVEGVPLCQPVLGSIHLNGSDVAATIEAAVFHIAYVRDYNGAVLVNRVATGCDG